MSSIPLVFAKQSPSSPSLFLSHSSAADRTISVPLFYLCSLFEIIQVKRSNQSAMAGCAFILLLSITMVFAASFPANDDDNEAVLSSTNKRMDPNSYRMGLGKRLSAASYRHMPNDIDIDYFGNTIRDNKRVDPQSFPVGLGKKWWEWYRFVDRIKLECCHNKVHHW